MTNQNMTNHKSGGLELQLPNHVLRHPRALIVNSELWGILSLGETYVEVLNGFNIRSFYILFTAIRSLKSWVAMI